MSKRKILPNVDVGFRFCTNNYGEAEVIEKKSSTEFVIRFKATEYIQQANLANIRSGKIKDQSFSLKNTFEKRSKEIYGDKYDYSRVEYMNEDTRVTLYCKEHDTTFTQTPRRHLIGQSGCPVCSSALRSASARSTQQEFLNKSVSIHGCKYNYERAVYTKNNEEVDIICYKHGVFKQQPSVHWMGCGCPKCGRESIGEATRKHQAQWEEECNLVHGNKYDYSKVKYVKAIEKVEIVCPIHGSFLQTPIAHLRGRGCRQCGMGGFVPELDGCVYVISTPIFTKIGVSRQPEIRAKQISGVTGIPAEVFHEKWMRGHDCLEVERLAHNYLREKGFETTTIAFHGMKESFSGLTPDSARDIVEMFSKGKDAYD